MQHIQSKNRHQIEFNGLENAIGHDITLRFIMEFNHDRLQHKTNQKKAFIRTLFFQTKLAA